MPAPTIGRIVQYTLSYDDAARINKRREDFAAYVHTEGYQDTGYIAHWGERAEGGQVLPLLITRCHGGSSVNGQVMLDGSDTFWVQSVSEGPDQGQWLWPVIRP